MIVVLDTNVCVSAFHFLLKRGAPVLALEKATKEDVIVLCDEIESEIVRVLAEKFRWDDARISEALDILGANAIRVKIHGTVSLCRDPDDNKILECAERAHADLIVTGDKDLLSLGTHRKTKILTPSDYLFLE
jgi:putative PIN family toxin of toxin-antitoxin system